MKRKTLIIIIISVLAFFAIGLIAILSNNKNNADTFQTLSPKNTPTSTLTRTPGNTPDSTTKDTAVNTTDNITESPAAITESPKPTLPEQTVLPGYTELTQNEVENIADLFLIQEDWDRTKDKGNWNFLTCFYNEPVEINLNEVLYDCSPVSMDNLTYEIIEELAGEDAGGAGVSVSSVDKINDYLLNKTGLQMKDFKKALTSDGTTYSYEYSEKYDAYYHFHGDTNYYYPVFISGQKSDSDNIYIINYKLYGPYSTVKFKMVGDDIKFISNLPIE